MLKIFTARFYIRRCRHKIYTMKKIICRTAALCLILFAATLSACSENSNSKTCEYEITAIYDGGNKLNCTVNFTYFNDTENEISDLKFNLYPNAYRQGAVNKPISETYYDKAYFSGQSYGKITVCGVEECSGWNVSGEDENILCVNLLAPVYPESTAKLKIIYEVDLANVNHRTGVTQHTVNLGNFYPVLCDYSKSGFVECNYYACGDPFVSDCADYTVYLEFPRGYIAATSGECIKTSEVGETVTNTYKLKKARDFAAVLSKEFTVASKTVKGVEISYYYYNDQSPEKKLNAACQSVEYFNETFGKYVYPTLSVVQTGFCYGGMEYPALTMISENLSEDDAIYTLVHENAHQWWYAMVGSDQMNEAWQDEGLAEYSALLFFENYPEYGFTRTGMVGSATKNYRAFFSVYKQIFGDADTTMSRNLKDFISEYEYANICYNKGLIMFDTLRVSLGDEKFFEGIKRYYETCIYKIAEPEDLYACFIKSGTDLEGFFDAFVNGKIVI